MKGDSDIRFITNEELFKQAIEPVKNARTFVWIGTADIKDLHVPYKGNVYSFLSVLDGLVKKGVAIRLLHAKEPGINFRNSLTMYGWESIALAASERPIAATPFFKR